MADVCIEFEPWNRYRLVPDPFIKYKKWVKENYPTKAYYFPRNKRQIHFLDEADLIMFKLQFGKCYTMASTAPDMTLIERMIIHETIIEQLERKSNDTTKIQ